MVPRWFVVLLVGLLCVSSVGAAPTPPAPDSPLLSWLRLVTDTPDHRKLLTYGDVDAWHRSWDVPRADSMAGVDGLDATAKGRWLGVMPAQTNLPSQLNQAATEEFRRSYGFNLFDVDRIMQIGAPPTNVTFWALRNDPALVATALAATGYTSRTLEAGGVLYSLGDDFQIQLNAHVPAPGKLGDFNRIAMLDGQTSPHSTLDWATAKATGPISESLAARSGEVRSLADAPDYQAAVAALDDPALADMGALMGVLFVDGPSLALGDPVRALQDLQQGLKPDTEGPPLPMYLTVAFATRHAAGASHLVLAVVFPPGVDAAAAAEVLGKRLRDYKSVLTRASLADRWSFEKAVGVTAGGLPVALVAMRVPDPPVAAAGDAKPAAVFSWPRMVYQRDMLFLTVGTSPR
jgi:hypothetical protein